ncbi:MAG: FtsX-like permease family protein [Acidobacteria bacterium]|nr:FtsX-like permease family protein [Acidobacteriota bacterium]
MIGAFAALALLVAAVGLYGVLAYTVSRRTAEIGLRMALGATRTTVRWMVLRHMTVISVCGGALGMTAALVLGQAAQTMLFGLKAHDPSVLAAATLVLLAVATLAALIPADRAARIDPNRALKYE